MDILYSCVLRVSACLPYIPTIYEPAKPACSTHIKRRCRSTIPRSKCRMGVRGGHTEELLRMGTRAAYRHWKTECAQDAPDPAGWGELVHQDTAPSLNRGATGRHWNCGVWAQHSAVGGHCSEYPAVDGSAACGVIGPRRSARSFPASHGSARNPTCGPPPEARSLALPLFEFTRSSTGDGFRANAQPRTPERRRNLSESVVRSGSSAFDRRHSNVVGYRARTFRLANLHHAPSQRWRRCALLLPTR